MDPLDDIKQSRNVLFLGQSGRGKSTTINTLANLCTYPDWRTAVDCDDPVVLVPFQYEHQYSDKTREVIKMNGRNSTDTGNEQTANPERSCTQSPRIYSFIKDDKAFNFIDMPGFGDTSGAAQDEKHKIERHEFIRNLTDLHAIIVVVDITESRLSAAFRAALSDVLALVPKAAVSNLFFIGTHAVITHFTKDEFVEMIQDYFNRDIKRVYEQKYNQTLNLSVKDNLYLVENEAFRHLVALHRSPKYRQLTDDRGDATKAMCWRRTRTTLFGMMSRVIEITSVSTTAISDIDYARNIMEAYVDFSLEIMNRLKDLKNPEKQNKLKTAMKETYQKLQPSTFCKNCTSHSKNDDLFNVAFKICHLNCDCLDKGFNVCKIFVNGKCKACKCPTNCHHSDKFDTTNDDRNAKVQKFISDYDEKVVKEYKQAEQVALMAASFLKENTILPLSKGYETRLQDQIKLRDNNGDIDAVIELEEVLETHKKKVKEIEAIMEKSPTRTTNAAELKRSWEQLFKLQIIGPVISTIFNKQTRHQFSFEKPCVFKATYFPEWN